MSETSTPPPEPVVEPAAVPPPPAPEPWSRRRDPLPWIAGAGFLILAGALLWVWRHPVLPRSAAEQMDALAQRVEALDGRVARLEQRPAPQMPDLGPLASRITALEQRPEPPPAQQTRETPPPDLGPLEERIAALEQRQPPNLAPLEAAVASLQNSERALQSDLTRRIDANEARLAAGEKRAGRVAQVQAAAMALAAGQKLGDLPGAPPALLRFADTSPPTEAGLRLAFPAAAHEALAVSHPDTEGKPLMQRLWSQAQELVTIRQGDRVLIGDPTAGVLERARAALDAGDLTGAVAAVATLEGPPAQAMSGWLAQARSLLDARAALATWTTAG